MQCIRASEDGKHLYTYANDYGLRQIDAATGKTNWCVRPGGHQRRIRECFALSPDGKEIALFSTQGAFRILNTADGSTVYPRLRPGGGAEELALAPDASIIATSRQDADSHWELSTGERLRGSGAYASCALGFAQWDQAVGVGVGFNDAFLAGMLCAIGWLLLWATDEELGGAALVFGELIGHLTLGREAFNCVHALGASERVATLAPTVLFALSGAVQWVASVRGPKSLAKLAPIGYGLLGLSAAKLLLVDLAGIETIMRALATLGVASLFLGAAFLGSRVETSD